MFVCRQGEFFGVGVTLLDSFEDLVENMELSYNETLDPADCEFFEQIEVNISSKTTWSIEPEYDE